MIINRDGSELSLTITPTRTENGETAGFLDFIPDYGGLPVIVGDVFNGSPADETGLKTGDRLVTVGNEQVKSAMQVTEYVRTHGGQVPITVERNGQTVQLTTPERRIEGTKLGFRLANSTRFTMRRLRWPRNTPTTQTSRFFV